MPRRNGQRQKFPATRGSFHAQQTFTGFIATKADKKPPFSGNHDLGIVQENPITGLGRTENQPSLDGLAGQLEVGLIAARSLFGGWGVTLVAILICVSLTASASAMTIVGPRVYYAFGRDSRALRALGTVVPGTGAPSWALVLQGVVTSFLIVSGRVDQIQQYAGLTLTLFASLSVSCLLVLRFRSPTMERPFRAWGYPWTPLLFLGVSLWMMLWAFRGRPAESLLSLLTVAVGGALFLFLRRSSRSGDGRDGELSSEEEGL